MNAKQLETFCSAWPGVGSRIKSEDDLVFAVCGRMFAVLCLRGPDRGRLSFKVEPEHYLELTEQPGIVPAHYAALAFWVTLVEPEQFADERIEAFVRRSYQLVCAELSRKQRAALGAGADGGAKH